MNNTAYAFSNEIFDSKNLTPSFTTSDFNWTTENNELPSNVMSPLLRAEEPLSEFLPEQTTSSNTSSYDYMFITFILVIAPGHGIFKCTGTLIADHWVLSTAECLVHDSIVAKNLFVVATNNGELNNYVERRLSTPSDEVIQFPNLQERKVDYFRIHPLYNKRTKSHNVGLIKLTTKFSFKILIPSLRLGKIEEVQKNCMIVGFELSKSQAGNLHFSVESILNLTISTPDIGCHKHEKKGYYICFSLKRKNDCPGETGVPLFCDGKILGIHSKEDVQPELIHMSYCEKTEEIYYVSLYYDRNWIGSIINKADFSVAAPKKWFFILLPALIIL